MTAIAPIAGSRQSDSPEMFLNKEGSAMSRLVYVLAVALCASVALAAEPPTLRDEAPPPPMLRGECQCGATCDCPACDGVCTVPVIADGSHNCPKCGTFANVVHREAGGQHSHVCPSCNTEFWHADPGIAAPVQYTVAPANPFTIGGDCANGQCARGVSRRVVNVSSTRAFERTSRTGPIRRLLAILFGRDR